jgi:protein-S-isoprenylcysteine O-methyltransferase Ste14
MAVLAAIAIGIWLLPAVYIFTPWLEEFNYSLPLWLVVAGVLVFASSIFIRWKAQAELGRAWSATIELSPHHPLVTTGIYSKVRHPLYASLILWAAGQPALLQNWIAGFAGAVAVALVWLVRVPAEEAMMRESFGEEYVRYSAQTGKLIPRRRSPDA